MLDRALFPRFHIGEGLHPGTEVLLNELGVAGTALKASLIRYDGVWIERGTSRSFAPFGADRHGRWRGFQVDRAEFDRALLIKAMQMGADVFSACRVSRVRRSDGAMLIDTELGQLRSSIVIDGTGSRRLVAEQLGAQPVRCSPLIIARYGYRVGEAPSLSERPVFSTKPYGWQWIARVRPGVFQWIRAYRAPDHPIRDDVPHRLRDLPESSPTRSVDVSWRILPEPAGRGFFAVGDAAAVLDPSCSHGVLQALSSGMMAAHCIQARLLRNATESTVTHFYNDWVHRRFNADSERLRSLSQLSGGSVTKRPNWR
jgi:flavin-dependent dehydrogenase